MNNKDHRYVSALKTTLQEENGAKLARLLNPYYAHAVDFEVHTSQPGIKTVDHPVCRRIAALHASVVKSIAERRHKDAFEGQKELLECVTFLLYVCV